MYIAFDWLIREKSILERRKGEELSKGLLALFYRARCRAATGLSGMCFETIVSRRTIEMIYSSEVTPVTIRGEFASLQIFPIFKYPIIGFRYFVTARYSFIYPY